MVGVSSISCFSHALEFDDFYIMDQDIVDFSMLSMNDLSTHDFFILPYDHVDPYDEEKDEDSHWPFLNHQ